MSSNFSVLTLGKGIKVSDVELMDILTWEKYCHSSDKKKLSKEEVDKMKAVQVRKAHDLIINEVEQPKLFLQRMCW